MTTDKTFYVDPKNVNTASFILDKEESHHIAQVFRLGIGSIITLLDGIGWHWFSLSWENKLGQ